MELNVINKDGLQYRTVSIGGKEYDLNAYIFNNIVKENSEEFSKGYSPAHPVLPCDKASMGVERTESGGIKITLDEHKNSTRMYAVELNGQGKCALISSSGKDLTSSYTLEKFNIDTASPLDESSKLMSTQGLEIEMYYEAERRKQGVREGMPHLAAAGNTFEYLTKRSKSPASSMTPEYLTAKIEDITNKAIDETDQSRDYLLGVLGKALENAKKRNDQEAVQEFNSDIEAASPNAEKEKEEIRILSVQYMQKVASMQDISLKDLQAGMEQDPKSERAGRQSLELTN